MQVMFCGAEISLNTVDSRYLEIEGTLKNTSRYPYFDISDLYYLREKQFEQPNFTNDYVNLLLLLEIYIENIVEKGRNCSQEPFLLFSTIFCNLILDFCIKTRTRFSLRDKRLFEITEVEITRADCR